MSFEVVSLFIALVAIFSDGAEQFEHFGYRTFSTTILSGLIEIHTVVTEEILFEVFSIFSSACNYFVAERNGLSKFGRIPPK